MATPPGSLWITVRTRPQPVGNFSHVLTDPDDRHEADRARRGERVAIHAAGDHYDLDTFPAVKEALRGLERITMIHSLRASRPGSD
ncbi:hypothetical protein [Streptomyces sp. NPDC005752]|uniref:hypothetical protein n=1 Tax=Streptomyces sp. NPDC005752 TaxID=3157065 RepID=UPI0033F4DC70